MIFGSVKSPATIAAISITEVNESYDWIVIKAILNVAVVRVPAILIVPERSEEGLVSHLFLIWKHTLVPG